MFKYLIISNIFLFKIHQIVSIMKVSWIWIEDIVCNWWAFLGDQFHELNLLQLLGSWYDCQTKYQVSTHQSRESTVLKKNTINKMVEKCTLVFLGCCNSVKKAVILTKQKKSVAIMLNRKFPSFHLYSKPNG